MSDVMGMGPPLGDGGKVWREKNLPLFLSQYFFSIEHVVVPLKPSYIWAANLLSVWDHSCVTFIDIKCGWNLWVVSWLKDHYTWMLLWYYISLEEIQLTIFEKYSKRRNPKNHQEIKKNHKNPKDSPTNPPQKDFFRICFFFSEFFSSDFCAKFFSFFCLNFFRLFWHQRISGSSFRPLSVTEEEQKKEACSILVPGYRKNTFNSH